MATSSLSFGIPGLLTVHSLLKLNPVYEPTVYFFTYCVLVPLKLVPVKMPTPTVGLLLTSIPIFAPSTSINPPCFSIKLKVPV